MRRAWLIAGGFAILAALIVWALASDGPTAPEPPRRFEVSPIAQPDRPASRDGVREGLTTRIAPKSFEDYEAKATGPPIRVLVVEADGHPVEAIQVLLLMKNDRNPSFATSSPTNQNGLAIVRKPKVTVNPDVTYRWSVTVGLPLAQPPEVIVDVDHPPADPIRLVIGATGRAVVHLVDIANRPVLEHALVNLVAVTADGRTPTSQVCSQSTDDGKAVFDRIGVDTMLRASAGCEGRRCGAETTGDGPRLAGGEVSLTMTVDVSKPFVTGRIMNEPGEPWPDTAFRGHVICGDLGRGPNFVTMRTDAAGRFRVEIVEGLVQGQERRLEIDHPTDAQGNGSDAQGAVDLTRTLLPGDTDVGDVALSRTPLIVSGVVLDEDGNPVGGAGLTMQGAETAGQNARWNWFPGLDHLPSANAEGKFEIRGVCKAAILRIAGHAPNCWADNPVEFTKGQQNVVLRVHPAGGIEGSVELPEGVKGKDVAVEVRIEEDGDSTWKAYGSAVWSPAGDDGSFHFEQLRCTSFRVQVKVPGDLFLPVEITSVLVHPGERTRDPRLQKIHILSRGRPVFLDVVDGNGHPIPGPSAAPIGLPPSSMANEHVVRANDSRIRVFLRDDSADFVVGAWNYRRKTVTVRSDQRVVLEQGIPVRFVVSGLDEPFPDGVHANLAISLETVVTGRKNRRPEDLVGVTSGDVIDPASHAASFRASEPGRYRYWVNLATAKRLAILVEGCIEVADVSTLQTFAATITADALRGAREKLEAK